MLGDTVARALALAGITEDRVSRWLGKPCGCAERREKLNALGYWASRVIRGRIVGAADYLQRILGDDA